MIKGLLLGFGFLTAAVLIAIGMVRYANGLGDSRGCSRSDPDDASEYDAH